MLRERIEFQNKLIYQYPHSSTNKHDVSDLVLFFSYPGKLPGDITFREIKY